MAEFWREEAKRTAETPYTCVWLVKAPWAHPVWFNYLIILYDLKQYLERKLIIYKEGMTHEFIMYALDPKYPVEDNMALLHNQDVHLLQPANHIYQFPAASDAQARKRMQSLVDAIVARQLSPDTDYTHVWDQIFEDGQSLKYNADQLMAEKKRSRVH